MKKFIKKIVYLFIVGIFTTSLFAKEIWRYDTNAFIGWNDIHKREVPIMSVWIRKIHWNNKEKRLSLFVKTDRKIYRDDFVFCSDKGSYYYCGIEDDGGHIKIDKQMNVQMSVAFVASLHTEPVLEFYIKQKDPKVWIPPIRKHNKRNCSIVDKQADKEMFFTLLKRYPEFSIDDIKPYQPGRYYAPKYGVSIVAPRSWHAITDEGDAILYLLRGKEQESSKFMLRVLTKVWKDVEEGSPRKRIMKISRFITDISKEEARKSGDDVTFVGKVNIFSKGSNTIGHFVLHRTGSKIRWESYTLIWDGAHLYLLSTILGEDELLLGEFLSALGMESFCSEWKR